MAQRWRSLYVFDWNGRTDKDGRFTWVEAPVNGMNFDFSLQHYNQIVEMPPSASDPPPTVTLRPELRVIGTVMDDQTAKPIDRFTVVKGWTGPGDKDHVSWERGASSDRTEGHEGKFDLIEDIIRDGYVVRIEKDGYLPAQSRVILPRTGRSGSSSD